MTSQGESSNLAECVNAAKTQFLGKIKMINDPKERIIAIRDFFHKLIDEIIQAEDNSKAFNGNKISILISHDSVVTKVIRPTPARAKVERVTPQESEQVTKIRKVLKGKRDSMYLFTLMNSLEGELGKLSQLDEESKEALAPIVLSMKDKLTRVIKNKQLGRVSNEKIIDVIGEGAGPIQDSE